MRWYSFWRYKCTWCYQYKPSPQLRFWFTTNWIGFCLLVLSGFSSEIVHVKCFRQILPLFSDYTYAFNLKRLQKFLRKHPELALEE